MSANNAGRTGAPLSFSNTEYAFAYKKDSELKKASWLFGAMGNRLMLKLGLALTPLVIRWKIPFTRTLIRNTLFSQFVGGETLEETSAVAEKLGRFGVDVILDYGVEGGHNGESDFEQAAGEFIKVIRYAGDVPNIPFISIKVTGIARFSLLEKIDSLMGPSVAPLKERYEKALRQINPEEQAEWERVVRRMNAICAAAAEKKTGVLVDAEETWIQDPVDALTMEMMELHNSSSAIVYNTIQLYRHDRLAFLKTCHSQAVGGNFLLAVKLVRGAYMEKERKRAEAMNYLSPIQPDIGHTHRDYNEAVRFCITHAGNTAIILASHNEESNLQAVELSKSCSIPLGHLHFSQLYGMSDHITFNLARAGFSVSKYLPFGPLDDVIPYLMRRAQENSSVGGQTGRELALIKKEMQRRKRARNS
jgi:proline dehydrogenase